MLRLLILALALVDGVLHLALDWVLFGGNLLGPLNFGPPPGGPPPGASGGPPPGPPPMPPGLLALFPLNQLFVLNFVGYVVLAALFWLGPRLLGPRRWVIDIVMVVYALLSIVSWLQIGKPNPMGLGYLSKAIEIVLIIALAIHARQVLRGSVRPAL